MQLKDYIKGNKHGKEANRLEREAMNDPFLQDAFDGLNSVAGDHAKIIEEIEEKFTRPAVVHKPKKKSLYYWTAAASVLLFIGIGTFFYQKTDLDDLAQYSEIQLNNFDLEILPDSFISQSEDFAEFKSEPMIAEARTKEITSSPEKKAIPPEKKESIIISSKEEATEEQYVYIADLADHKVVVEEPATLSFREQEKQVVQNEIVEDAKETILSATKAQNIPQSPFGEKEFLTWCKQEAGKNICEGKKASVKVTFFIDEMGKPTNFEYQKYSCEEAKKEMEKLLLSSPVWTKTNRKVTITFNW